MQTQRSQHLAHSQQPAGPAVTVGTFSSTMLAIYSMSGITTETVATPVLTALSEPELGVTALGHTY
jgi:hypothetical protein